jgi:hypothetical protein
LGFRYAKIGQRAVVPCAECGEEHSAEDGDAERRPYLPRCALDARALAAAVQWYVRQHNASQLRSRKANTYAVHQEQRRGRQPRRVRAEEDRQSGDADDLEHDA